MDRQEVDKLLEEYVPDYYIPNSFRQIPSDVYQKVVLTLTGDNKVYGVFYTGHLGPLILVPAKEQIV